MTFIFYFFYIESMFLSFDDYLQRVQRKGVRKSGKVVGQKSPEPLNGGGKAKRMVVLPTLCQITLYSGWKS